MKGGRRRDRRSDDPFGQFGRELQRKRADYGDTKNFGLVQRNGVVQSGAVSP